MRLRSKAQANTPSGPAGRGAGMNHEQDPKNKIESESLDILCGPPGRMEPGARNALLQQYREAISSFLLEHKDAKTPAKIAKCVAEEFYKKRLGGRETIDLHLEVVNQLTVNLEDDKSQKFVEQSRFLILGILAYMTDLYRGKDKK
jgi:hypothetical protein